MSCMDPLFSHGPTSAVLRQQISRSRYSASEDLLVGYAHIPGKYRGRPDADGDVVPDSEYTPHARVSESSFAKVAAMNAHVLFMCGIARQDFDRSATGDAAAGNGVARIDHQRRLRPLFHIATLARP